MGHLSLRPTTLGATLAAALAFFAAGASAAPLGVPGVIVVGYEYEAHLERAASDSGARILRRIPALRVAEVSGGTGIARADGIRFVTRRVTRAPADEPGLATGVPGVAPQWQYFATGVDAVPEHVLRAAGAITIAVIDTGADVSAPDLAAKAPHGFDVRTRSPDVSDRDGHGTFVASIAAGSVTNGEGVAGFGGDAGLLVVKASAGAREITDVDEAAAIVYAVDRGARIVNLSFGGPATSRVERRAVEYAVARGVLLVAAVGNDHARGNPVHYPAALFQPVGSRGRGGVGLAVGATTLSGQRARFSNTGTHISLAAPGDRVLGAISELSSRRAYPRVALPGSRTGQYAYASGTSFAAPQVAGAAALVWAANPALAAQQVAQVLKSTASGGGHWNPRLGWGEIDVAAAVARATALR